MVVKSWKQLRKDLMELQRMKTVTMRIRMMVRLLSLRMDLFSRTRILLRFLWLAVMKTRRRLLGT